MVNKILLLLILAHLQKSFNLALQDVKLGHPNEVARQAHPTTGVLPRTVLPHQLTSHIQTTPTHRETIILHQAHSHLAPTLLTQISTLPQTGSLHPEKIFIHPQTVPTAPQKILLQATHPVSPRQKKGPSIISFPITQLLLPKFHIIPTQYVHTNVNHFVTSNNLQIPVISQGVSHSANITHSPLISVLIPVHHNLVPLQDLSVIPLQKNVHGQNLGHYTAMEKKDGEDEEPVNRFRTFYGGYGTGLFFGGHGAGHGFHIFG